MVTQEKFDELLRAIFPEEVVSNYIVIVKTNKRVLRNLVGEAYTLNGLLDYAKRTHFLDMYEKTDKQPWSVVEETDSADE